MECDGGTNSRIKGGNELVRKDQHRRKAHTYRINIANYAGLINAENTHTHTHSHARTHLPCSVACVLSANL